MTLSRSEGQATAERQGRCCGRRAAVELARREGAYPSRPEPRHQLDSDPCCHHVRASAHGTAIEGQVPDVAWPGRGAEAAEAEAAEAEAAAKEVADVEARREQSKRIEIRKR